MKRLWDFFFQGSCLPGIPPLMLYEWLTCSAYEWDHYYNVTVYYSSRNTIVVLHCWKTKFCTNLGDEPKVKGISCFGRAPFHSKSLGAKDPGVWTSLNLSSLCQTMCPILLWTRDVFCLNGAFDSGLLRKTKKEPKETQRNSNKFWAPGLKNW